MIEQKYKDNINKSVVRIFAEVISINPYIPFNSIPPARGQGTGFFIDNKGHILTCSHVVDSSINILIDIPSISTDKIKCELIYIVPKFDLALLKVIDYKNKNFLELGNSDNIKMSDKVFAVGFPKSINTVGGNNIKYTLGIVSGHQEGLIQTDTAINPGNSGGPLFKDNKVVGVNSSKMVGGNVSNIGYVVPINYFKNIKNNKNNKSKIINRPLLNCIVNNTDNSVCNTLTNNNTGIYISKIYSKSIFKDIGEDIYLTKFDKYKIDNFGYIEKRWIGEKIHLKNILNFYKNNEKIDIEYYSNKKKISKKIKLIDNKPIIDIMHSNFEKVDFLILGGAVLMNLYIDHDEKIAIINEMKDLYEEKVIISYILPNTVFNVLGNINTGSVIKEINDQEVNTLDTIRKVLKKPFKINGTNIVKIKDNNDNINILNIEKVIKENKNLSKIYKFNNKNIIS